ncbi:alpha-glucan family phosphorylase [Candidatus Fermentibacterales bacterium]|nr:alpha-glucan family phosphorylase [Candidatus Fermentibacterales bacterium]
MKTRFVRVVPSIPEELIPLQEVAYNLWWTWSPGAVDLFRYIDPEIWNETDHNAVLLLGRVSQNRLAELAADAVFLARLRQVRQDLSDYLERPTWYDSVAGKEKLPEDFLIATFSAEFGVHESLPIYSGGLGILAGDTLKSVSELGLPMVGVSLLYRQGYFKQYLNSDGWQQEKYFVNDYSNTPVNPVLDESGDPVRVMVPMGAGQVGAQVWEVRIGRTSLYLLDTNIETNDPEDREITGQLYGGDRRMRIRQEILLGMGGVRALSAIGRDPSITHINEGHSAFLILERIGQLTRRGLSFEEARGIVAASCVFTTHTPVPAGNEEFDPSLVEEYLGPVREELGLTQDQFLALGRTNGNHCFSMTAFALRMTDWRNGVSELHGREARKMWMDVWPGLPEDDIPIEHVTNGVHADSWISDEMSRLLDRYVGPRWPSTPLQEAFWTRLEKIPGPELWNSHERLRERMVTFARERWSRQIARWGVHLPRMDEVPVLNPEVLTIGFARRVAAYKRANLLLDDEERLSSLLNHPGHPVQLVFAGKAHPHDSEGKELISRIVHLCLREGFYGKIVYLEDYNMDMARHLVQGVDLWLNTPVRPMEASGTSGMKASLNGVLNCSILDGWWDEAYSPDAGWAIGRGETYDDPELRDGIEARALYDRLENEIAPLFYDRGRDGLPRKWLALMVNSMTRHCPRFNMNRMLAEYFQRFYLPSFRRLDLLTGQDMKAARELADWKQKLRMAWGDLRILEVESPSEEGNTMAFGSELPVRARLAAPGLGPEDLAVEVHFGRESETGGIREAHVARLDHAETGKDSELVFDGGIQCTESGRMGYTIRVLPAHPVFGTLIEPGLITWWE